MSQELRSQESALAVLRAQLETVSRNLVLAETADQYRAVAPHFEGLKAEEKLLEAEVVALR